VCLRVGCGSPEIQKGPGPGKENTSSHGFCVAIFDPLEASECLGAVDDAGGTRGDGELSAGATHVSGACRMSKAP